MSIVFEFVFFAVKLRCVRRLCFQSLSVFSMYSFSREKIIFG